MRVYLFPPDWFTLPWLGGWRGEQQSTMSLMYQITVFCSAILFYYYIATVFVIFLYVCVFVHPVSSKSLCGAVLRRLNTKMGWKPEIAAELCEDRDTTGSKCIILSIRPQLVIKMEKTFFLCVLRSKWTSKKPLVQCVCFFYPLIMRALGFVLRCLSSVDWLNAPAERGNVNEEDRSLCLHFSFMKRDVTCFLRRILVSVRVCDCETRTDVSLRHTNIYKQRGMLLMGHNAGLSRVFVASVLEDVTLTCWSTVLLWINGKGSWRSCHDDASRQVSSH